ncbi:MAG: ROK family transcriptional regulator [Hyphomicrobiaceae bacterium]|nr:ROK family transcriptional regulator [Hyphomicrobiaceae bacterium]MCC0024433.1 ROK family transcriptional regulator [Hyphomicrobiaceae bacterium]
MKRAVSDADSMRRHNRALVLRALRQHGELSRTQIAQETGLSHASVSAMIADLMLQGVLKELPIDFGNQRVRGRPAINVSFERGPYNVLVIEIDVGRIRTSLVDYSGTLVDRIDRDLTPEIFQEQTPTELIAERIERMLARNPDKAELIARGAISVQGILNRDGSALKWSPVPGFSGHNISGEIGNRFGFPFRLFKRGRLLAEGTRWLYPELRSANVATVFLGSTIGLGMTLHGHHADAGDDAATEFGHMVHIPGGALCRCGMRGCIEAYAADYAVLRKTYGVKDTTQPAPAVPLERFFELIDSARRGERNVKHAFTQAGSAIGFGISRLMTVFDLTHVMLVGPGARALPFMREALEAALADSLVGRIHGLPEILAQDDESQPVFKGLVMKLLGEVDELDVAALPSFANSAGGA